MKLSKWAAAAVLMFLPLTGCIDSEEIDGTTQGPGNNRPDVPGAELVNGTMSPMEVSGFVTDSRGNVLEGVRVISGTSSAMTDANGGFVLTEVDVNNDRTLVAFEKDGYFKVTRSLPSSVGSDWKVALVRKGEKYTASASFNSETQKVIATEGMSVTLPSGAYVNEASGEPYTGTVNAEIFYLAPDNEEFAALMPGGDMRAVRSNESEAVLVSYGMTNVQLTDDKGNRLQTKAPSKIKFPVPANMTGEPMSTIPMWSFDDATGLWKEEGTATFNGTDYEAEVGHFSWWNLDYPEEEGTVSGTVTDEEGTPVAGLRVCVGQITVVTDFRGYYRTQVPANTPFDIWVKSEAYGNYCLKYTEVRKGLIRVDSYQHKIVDLVMPVLPKLCGRVIDRHGDGVFVSVLAKWKDGSITGPMFTDADGRFSTQAPVGDYPQSVTFVCTDFEGHTIEETRVVTGKACVDDIHFPDYASTIISGNFFVHFSDDRTARYTVAPSPMNPSGVFVSDSMLVMTNDYEGYSQSRFALIVDKFSLNRTTFDVEAIALMTPNLFMTATQGTAKIELSPDRTVFNFVLEGNAYAAGLQQSEYFDDMATYDSKTISMPVAMMTEYRYNVRPSQAGFPSFTPTDEVAPVAMIVSGSMMGNGGMLFYNGNRSDFDALRRKAADTKGFTLAGQDKDDGMVTYMYTNANSTQLIAVSYDPEGSPITNPEAFDYDMDDPQIGVMAIDNYNGWVDMLDSRATAKSLHSIMREESRRLFESAKSKSFK